MVSHIVSGKLTISRGYIRHAAFTLIELMVVMAVIAVLLTIALPRYFGSIDKSKEAALKTDLSIMRDAIDKYFGDTGKYPMTLSDLEVKKYIKKIPVDPITERSDTWIVVPPLDLTKGNVYDVKSGAEVKSTNGELYSEW